jgi:hypothetical protein
MTVNQYQPVSGSRQRVSVRDPGNALGSLAGVYQSVAIPPGVGPLNEMELILFHEFTRAREPTDWLPHELRAVVQLCRVEALGMRALSEVTEFQHVSPTGLSKPNPVLAAALRLIQVGGLMKTKLGLAYDTRTATAAVGNSNPARRAMAQAAIINNDGDDGLLAAPVPER